MILNFREGKASLVNGAKRWVWLENVWLREKWDISF